MLAPPHSFSLASISVMLSSSARPRSQSAQSLLSLSLCVTLGGLLLKRTLCGFGSRDQFPFLFITQTPS